MQAAPHQNEACDIGAMEISLEVEAGLSLKIKGSFETYFFRTLTVQPAASTANQLTDFNKFCAEKRCATASVSTTFLVTLTYKFVVTTINK